MEEHHTCKDCRFWIRTGPPGSADGLCYYYPPQVVCDRSERPSVHMNSFCHVVYDANNRKGHRP